MEGWVGEGERGRRNSGRLRGGARLLGELWRGGGEWGEKYYSMVEVITMEGGVDGTELLLCLI